MAVTLAFVALLIEATFGYPDWLFRAIGHPVTWMGRLIAVLDGVMNRTECGDRERRRAGIVTMALVLAIAVGAGLVLERGLRVIPFALFPMAIIASTLIAQRSLFDHVLRVAEALERDGIAGARKAVSQIVGRDTAALDEAGVARAAIESLAENFSDGVVAPTVWLAAAGLAGGSAYKAINTADSMIGHRTPRHEAFGWAAARLDDLVNLPASRLAASLIVAAATIAPGANARRAWDAVLRDAPRHRSPNAGYPEAAVAGALGLALAGPRVYGGVEIEDATMGGGRRAAKAADIRAALRLCRYADSMLIGLVGLLALIVTMLG
jgi:adenosylcobinamide-phosphate synthase